MKGKHYEVEIHIKRILIAIPTFFGITILAYFILNMAPGSPLDALLADPELLPQSWNVREWHWDWISR